MKVKELRNLSETALRARAEELLAEVSGIRFLKASKRDKNVRKVRALRHERARALTILEERGRSTGETP